MFALKLPPNLSPVTVLGRFLEPGLLALFLQHQYSPGDGIQEGNVKIINSLASFYIYIYILYIYKEHLLSMPTSPPFARRLSAYTY